MNKKIDIVDAFGTMQLFLEAYYKKTGSDAIGGLLGDLNILEGGSTADPAAWINWVKDTEKIITPQMNKMLTPEEAFEVFRLFLERYHRETSAADVASLLNDMQILPNGKLANPATWQDWLEAIDDVKAGKADVYPHLI